jgi:hypothetical protein
MAGPVRTHTNTQISSPTLYIISYHVGSFTQKEIVVSISVTDTTRKCYHICLGQQLSIERNLIKTLYAIVIAQRSLNPFAALIAAFRVMREQGY